MTLEPTPEDYRARAAYTGKPVDVDELLQVLAQAISRSPVPPRVRAPNPLHKVDMAPTGPDARTTTTTIARPKPPVV